MFLIAGHYGAGIEKANACHKDVSHLDFLAFLVKVRKYFCRYFHAFCGCAENAHGIYNAFHCCQIAVGLPAKIRPVIKLKDVYISRPKLVFFSEILEKKNSTFIISDEVYKNRSI